MKYSGVARRLFCIFLTLIVLCASACTSVQVPDVKPDESPSEPTDNTDSSDDDREITFTTTPGFYAGSSLDVVLTPKPGFTIYYTTNSSKPVPDTAYTFKYESPVHIEAQNSTDGSQDKVTVIKAICVGEGATGEVYTGTYFVNSQYSSYSERYGVLPVFSISTDESNLFGEKGIYTNFTEHGRQTEREATIEYFDQSGYQAVNMPAGIRIYGGTSRGLSQKSIKIVARKEYGTSGRFKYAFFDDLFDEFGNKITKFNSVVLRAGGNDSLLSGDGSTFLRDALVHSLAKKIDNVTGMDARPVVVYLNGRYWGWYFLREAIDKDYVESHFGVDKDNVAIIAYGHENGNWFYKIDEGTEADIANFQQMVQQITSKNMYKDANFAEASELVDVDNIMKYFAINMYANNRDWPHNNITMWRYLGEYNPSNPYTDGKWRFILKDIDYSWGRYDNPDPSISVKADAIAYFGQLTAGAGSDAAAVFSALLKNTSFRHAFVNMTCDIMNQYYEQGTVSGFTNNISALVEKEVPFHLSCRWVQDESIAESTGLLNFDLWQQRVKDEIFYYASERPKHIVNALSQYCNAGSGCELTVNFEGREGVLNINTLKFDMYSRKIWKGTYMYSTPVPFFVDLPEGCNASFDITSDNGKAVIANDKIQFNKAKKVTITVKIEKA